MLINISLFIVNTYGYYTFQALNLRGQPCLSLYALVLPDSMIERERCFGFLDFSENACELKTEKCDGVFIHGCRVPNSLSDRVDVLIFIVKNSNLKRDVKKIHTTKFPQSTGVFLLLDNKLDVLIRAFRLGIPVQGVITNERFHILDSTLRISLLSAITGYLLMAMYVFLMMYQKRVVTILPVTLNAQKTRKALESEMYQTCPICLEEFTEESILRELTCRHVFHKSCVDPWLLDWCCLCPLCRKGPGDA
eukprot:jgi/Antlo1/2437/2576